MRERQPSTTPELELRDYHKSLFLTFGSDSQIDGDPTSEDAFNTALCYLEVIMDEFIQSGQFWQKTASDVAGRLLYHNERHRYEVEQEHRVGEISTTYLEVTIHQLRALSERQRRAMAAMGWEQSEAYQKARFLHTLVEQVAVSDEEMQEFVQVIVPSIYLLSETGEDPSIPF